MAKFEMRVAAFLQAILILFAASTARAEPAVTVPMLPYGPYPAVNVTVNGTGPYLFLIDTGANGLARIDASVAQSLHLPDAGTATAGTVVSNRTIQMRQVRADLRIGTRRYQGVEAPSRSYDSVDYLPHIGGILAFGLFRDQLLTLDFCGRRVRIEDGTLPAADGRTIVDYEDRNGIPYLRIAIGNQRAMALLDTGDVRALDLPTALLRQLYLASYPRLLGRPAVSLAGQEGGVNIVTLEDPVVIGAQRFERLEATFSANWTLPILGSSMFRDAVLTFDQTNRRVRIERPRRCRAGR